MGLVAAAGVPSTARCAGAVLASRRLESGDRPTGVELVPLPVLHRAGAVESRPSRHVHAVPTAGRRPGRRGRPHPRCPSRSGFGRRPVGFSGRACFAGRIHPRRGRVDRLRKSRAPNDHQTSPVAAVQACRQLRLRGRSFAGEIRDHLDPRAAAHSGNRPRDSGHSGSRRRGARIRRPDLGLAGGRVSARRSRASSRRAAAQP